MAEIQAEILTSLNANTSVRCRSVLVNTRYSRGLVSRARAIMRFAIGRCRTLEHPFENLALSFELEMNTELVE